MVFLEGLCTPDLWPTLPIFKFGRIQLSGFRECLHASERTELSNQCAINLCISLEERTEIVFFINLLLEVSSRNCS
jgi:hypothetical protein